MKRVVHLTSAHPRFDIRIFLKECVSLADAGMDVTLVVADDLGDERTRSVKIIDVGRSGNGRLFRMTLTVWRIYRRSRELNGDVFHFHDPELIPAALLLRLSGRKVIYDVHEDLPASVMSRPWIAKWLRRAVSVASDWIESFAIKKMTAVIGATPTITARLRSHNNRAANINNFPIIGELGQAVEKKFGSNTIAYVGGISELRGIKQIVTAMADVPAKLELLGLFESQSLREEVASLPGWEKVNERGQLGRQEVRQTLLQADAGLVTFLPAPNHIHAQPTKMFEYMSAGVPVICSDFSLWREIVEGYDCGLAVNPESPEAIAKAMNYILRNSKEARQMGRRGNQAVRERYNWALEERKLIQLYDEWL